MRCRNIQGKIFCSFAGYFLPVLFCMLSMLISDSRFDLVWFRLSCDHGWIRSGSVNVRKQQHHFGKKNIGNVIPSSAKYKTVHPPPTERSPPSGVGRDCRLRIRHPEITSSASKRAVSRDSAGGTGTMSDIEKKKSPVKRDSYVKTEVQLCL